MFAHACFGKNKERLAVDILGRLRDDVSISTTTRECVMSSKREQAQKIFDSVYKEMDPNSRVNIITMFIHSLDMTPAGAATYYANCKKTAQGRTLLNSSYGFQQSPFPSITKSVEVDTKFDAAKKAVIDRHHQLYEVIKQKYKIDLTGMEIAFDLKGRAAGMARRRGMRFWVRYNLQTMTEQYLKETIDNTIPHELAHIICMKNPSLGKGHDAGWKRVCRVLGGDDSRCHSMNLKTSKRMTKYQYAVGVNIIEVGAKVHYKIQKGAKYFCRKTDLPLVNFIGTVVRGGV